MEEDRRREGEEDGEETATEEEQAAGRVDECDLASPLSEGRPTDDPREEFPEEIRGPTEEELHSEDETAPSIPNLTARRPGRRLVKPESAPRVSLTSQQRLLLLDTWRRSALPAGDFGSLVGVSKHTLYAWKKRFEEGGPAGLEDQPRGAPGGSRVPEVTRRAIVMMKQDNPEWGCQRIADVLARAQGLGASAKAVAGVLHEEGYELEDIPTRPHRDHVRTFERARPNEMWQTDLFTFVLKRQNRRVHLVAFMDDHSRFLVGYGLHATASAALVIEAFRAAIASYHAPGEILTDNGSQYVTWRGKSAFARECETRGVKHLVAAPRHPRTLGKIERFWGTLWRECLSAAVFLDLEDARRRVGLFIDHYNFQRPHQGLGGSVVPADRYFGQAEEVLKTLKARVAANARELACNGIPREPLYLTGQLGGKSFSVHAEGERVILTKEGEGRREIEWNPPERKMAPEPLCPQGAPRGEDGNEEPPSPGTSAIDALPRGER
jgi:putative transposase